MAARGSRRIIFHRLCIIHQLQLWRTHHRGPVKRARLDARRGVRIGWPAVLFCGSECLLDNEPDEGVDRGAVFERFGSGIERAAHLVLS